MKENEKITDALIKNKKPTVPKGFFDQFTADLLHKIIFKSSLLGQLKKREKPILSKNYFLHEEVTLKEIRLEQFTQRKKPIVPANFFVDFEVNTAEQRKIYTKPFRVIPINFLRAFTTLAAALLVFFVVYKFNAESNTIEPIVSTENYETYLTYLEEDDIIDFLIENEISLTEDITTIYYDTYSIFSEEDIEEYYLAL